MALRAKYEHPDGPSHSAYQPKSTLLATVLESFQDHVSDRGLIGVSEGALGTLGFAGLLSSLLGEPAIKAGAIVAALVTILGLFVLLVASRSKLQSRNEVTEQLMRRYYYALESRYHHEWHTRTWDHVISIDRRGNTTEEISCTIVADSEFVDYFTVWSGAGRAWPIPYQRKVRYHVATAMSGAEGGVRPTGTHIWRDRDYL